MASVDDRMSGSQARAIRSDRRQLREITGPTEILPGVWLTRRCPRVHPERNWGTLGKVRRDGKDVDSDTVPEDMAMIFQTDQGLVDSVRTAATPG
jgi:metal-dependent hydrolase (beta-lactamase superfamily II)